MIKIQGADFHPEFQQIAAVDTDPGEFQEKRLAHREEAEKFYRGLAAVGQPVRVGMEASGQARCFERLLSELQLELWIGDAAEIQSKRVRKQKTDRQASLGLDLALLQLERNGALLRVHGEVLSKQYLTPPTLSETPVNSSYL
jgi:hypothetical protein